jgi:tetratricopeptide (TPR) repeat protein
MDKNDLFLNGQRLFLQGKHEESIDYFTRSIEAGGKTDIALLSRGVAFLKLQHADKAIHDFSRVMELNENNFRAHFYRGMAHMAKENYSDAIKDFDRTIKLQPESGAAYFARGTSYAQIGNMEEAERNIKTAVTCSESDMQGFADHHGMFRIQFERAMTFMTGEGDALQMSLTDKELGMVKKWLEDTNH